MIITRLNGGLGNQMFQYAIGRMLALKNNTQLYLDTTAYDHIAKGDTPRAYELDVYAIDGTIADETVLQQVQPVDSHPNLVDKIARRMGAGKVWPLGEGEPSLNTLALGAPNNTCLVGYWQNEAYFTGIRGQIIDDFTPKAAPSPANKKVLDSIIKSDAVAIHVRRGDLVSNPNANAFHGLTPLDYYKQSVAYIRNKVENPRFFVFSDDLAWCRQNFDLGKDAVFVDGNGGKKAYEDIRLMHHCKHNIIANSSFSWWGAWLNDNPHKIVIAPATWFQDKEANSKTQIVPKVWVRI